jgi:hypothetical protein
MQTVYAMATAFSDPEEIRQCGYSIYIDAQNCTVPSDTVLSV